MNMKLRTLGAAYTLVALVTFGFVFPRAQDVLQPSVHPTHGMAAAGAIFCGIGWPLYWTAYVGDVLHNSRKDTP